jgi:hypothetical protein
MKTLGSEAASAAAVQEILRVFLEYDFTGSFGTYRTVVGISAGAETLVRTEDSALAYGAAGRARRRMLAAATPARIGRPPAIVARVTCSPRKITAPSTLTTGSR